MEPTNRLVFVEKQEAKANNKYEIVGKTPQFKVVKVGKAVSSCKKGDFVLFSDSHTYIYKDKNIMVVKEDDIEGVAHA